MSKRYRLRSRPVDGNPNLEYIYKESESEEEEQPIGENIKIKTEKGTEVEIDESEEPELKKAKTNSLVDIYKEELKQTLYFAMQPIYTFIGQLEAALGGQDVRYHYQWKKGASLHDRMIPFIDGDYETIEEVKKANPQLGREEGLSKLRRAASRLGGVSEKKQKTNK